MEVFILSEENRILGVFFEEENVVQYVKDQFPNMQQGRDYITFRPGGFGDLNRTNYIDVLSFGCEFEYRVQMLQTKDELTSDFLMKELDNRVIFESGSSDMDAPIAVLLVSDSGELISDVDYDIDEYYSAESKRECGELVCTD